MIRCLCMLHRIIETRNAVPGFSGFNRNPPFIITFVYYNGFLLLVYGIGECIMYRMRLICFVVHIADEGKAHLYKAVAADRIYFVLAGGIHSCRNHQPVLKMHKGILVSDQLHSSIVKFVLFVRRDEIGAVIIDAQNCRS